MAARLVAERFGLIKWTPQPRIHPLRRPARRQGLFLRQVDTEAVRARQTRPRRRRPHEEIDALERTMRTWLRRHVARGDNPPGRFLSRWDSNGPWKEWSPREEADWVRWCLMEDETSYDDADAEMRDVVADEEGTRLVRTPGDANLAHPLYDVGNADIIAAAIAPTRQAHLDRSTSDRPSRAA